jgi:hypothetical protein
MSDAFGALGSLFLHHVSVGGSRIFPSPATIIARLLSAAAKNIAMFLDFHGDHPSTYTAHAGASKAHD